MSATEESLGLTQSYKSPEMGSPQAFVSQYKQTQQRAANQAIFQTPLPVQTPAIKASASNELLNVVEMIQTFQRNFDGRMEMLEMRIQQMQALQANQQQGQPGNPQLFQLSQTTQKPVTQSGSIVHNTNANLGIGLNNPRVVQLTPDMIVISSQQLERLVEEKVKLRIRQYEDDIKTQQQLEIRVRQLEESLNVPSRVATSVQFQPGPNMPTNTFREQLGYLGNSISTDLRERIDRIQAQVQQVSSYIDRK